MKKKIYPIVFVIMMMIFVLITGLLCSCTPKSRKTLNAQERIAEKAKRMDSLYSFNSFGTIFHQHNPAAYNVSTVAIGDVDGDGDNDIVVGNQQGAIYILENKISQKDEQ